MKGFFPVSGVTKTLQTAGRYELFRTLLLAFLGITLGRAFFGYLRDYLFDVAGPRIAVDIYNCSADAAYAANGTGPEAENQHAG